MQIWEEYHKTRDCVGCVMPSEQYVSMYTKASHCPLVSWHCTYTYVHHCTITFSVCLPTATRRWSGNGVSSVFRTQVLFHITHQLPGNIHLCNCVVLLCVCVCVYE